MSQTQESVAKQHTDLLHAATDEIVSAVLELHAPVWIGDGHRFGYAECGGCDLGSYPYDKPFWPCSTVDTLNRFLHVW